MAWFNLDKVTAAMATFVPNPPRIYRPNARPGGGLKREMTMSLTNKGLLNPSGQNNCFLNSAVQVLWHIDVFRRSFRMFEGHSCVGKSCIFCALKALFTEFQHSDQSALPPDILRRAMAECYEEEHRFQLGLMDDAAECFEKILEQIHFHLTGDDDLDSCSTDFCISHRKFALNILERTECICGATSEPLAFVQFVHYISTSAIIAECEKLKKDGKFDNSMFGKIFRTASAFGELRECPDYAECGKMVPVKRFLLNCPDVGLIWDSDRPSVDYIMNVIHAIGLSLCLTDAYDQVASDHARVNEYTLTGVVAYYGRHYSTFCYHTHLKEWVYFDDAKFRKISTSWSDVVELCRKAHYQPLLLIYTNAFAENVDISKAPREVKMVYDHKISNVPKLASVAEEENEGDVFLTNQIPAAGMQLAVTNQIAETGVQAGVYDQTTGGLTNQNAAELTNQNAGMYTWRTQTPSTVPIEDRRMVDLTTFSIRPLPTPVSTDSTTAGSNLPSHEIAPPPSHPQWQPHGQITQPHGQPMSHPLMYPTSQVPQGLPRPQPQMHPSSQGLPRPQPQMPPTSQGLSRPQQQIDDLMTFSISPATSRMTPASSRSEGETSDLHPHHTVAERSSKSPSRSPPPPTQMETVKYPTSSQQNYFAGPRQGDNTAQAVLPSPTQIKTAKEVPSTNQWNDLAGPKDGDITTPGNQTTLIRDVQTTPGNQTTLVKDMIEFGMTPVRITKLDSKVSPVPLASSTDPSQLNLKSSYGISDQVEGSKHYWNAQSNTTNPHASAQRISPFPKGITNSPHVKPYQASPHVTQQASPLVTPPSQQHAVSNQTPRQQSQYKSDWSQVSPMKYAALAAVAPHPSSPQPPTLTSPAIKKWEEFDQPLAARQGLTPRPIPSTTEPTVSTSATRGQSSPQPPLGYTQTNFVKKTHSHHNLPRSEVPRTTVAQPTPPIGSDPPYAVPMKPHLQIHRPLEATHPAEAPDIPIGEEEPLYAVPMKLHAKAKMLPPHIPSNVRHGLTATKTSTLPTSGGTTTVGSRTGSSTLPTSGGPTTVGGLTGSSTLPTSGATTTVGGRTGSSTLPTSGATTTVGGRTGSSTLPTSGGTTTVGGRTGSSTLPTSGATTTVGGRTGSSTLPTSGATTTVGGRTGSSTLPTSGGPTTVGSRAGSRVGTGSGAPLQSVRLDTPIITALPVSTRTHLMEAMDAWAKAEASANNDDTVALMLYTQAAGLLLKVLQEPSIATNQTLYYQIQARRGDALKKCAELRTPITQGGSGQEACSICGRTRRQLDERRFCGPCQLRVKLAQS